MDIQEIIAGWDRGDGKPMKGSLVDYSAWENGGGHCAMCAQGQVLHLAGGWSPEKLRDTEQSIADKETAKLLNISIAHAILLRSVNDKTDGAPSIVLTAPEKVLGDQARIVLAFWLHMDGMTAEQRDAARDAACACSEIQGAALLRERGKPFFFLPLFGFADPEAIPALPASYGVQA